MPDPLVLPGPLADRWRKGFEQANPNDPLALQFYAGKKRAAEELEAALATLPQPTEQPFDHLGQGRLLLNEYGRACYRAGQDSRDAAAPVLPAPLQEQEPICTCGTDNPQSARYRHSHLAWCALAASPPAQEQEPDFDQIARRLTDQANAITPLTKGMIYYDIKDALREVWNARALPPAHGWQPIETAPKDGTIIDVWLGQADEEECKFYCSPGSKRSASWHWRQERFRPYMGFGMPVVTVRPTHWSMPLPAPPVPKGQTETT